VPDLHVDGSWMSARAGERREIRCPADGTLVAEVDEAGAADTEAAIGAAHAAFHRGAWSGTSSRERGDLLLRLADLLERDVDTIARMESLDTGKRLAESEYDVADVVSVFRHYGRVAAEDSGRVVDTGNADVVSRIVHEPIGVCGLSSHRGTTRCSRCPGRSLRAWPPGTRSSSSPVSSRRTPRST